MKDKEFEKLAQKAGLNKEEIETFKSISSFSMDFERKLTHFLKAKTITNEEMPPFFNPTEDVQGEINFALTYDNEKVGVYQEEPHMLIVGQTGTGKSTLLLNILTEILKLEK